MFFFVCTYCVFCWPGSLLDVDPPQITVVPLPATSSAAVGEHKSYSWSADATPRLWALEASARYVAMLDRWFVVGFVMALTVLHVFDYPTLLGRSNDKQCEWLIATWNGRLQHFPTCAALRWHVCLQQSLDIGYHSSHDMPKI